MTVNFFNQPYVLYENEINNINMKAIQHKIGCIWYGYSTIVIVNKPEYYA